MTIDNRPEWDVIIIGSGAGGGTVAHQLSQAGVNVLLLEKGKAYRSSDYVHDELAMIHDSFFTPDPSHDPHTVVTKKTTTPVRHKLGWSASCVGGGTEHMGAYLYRFHPDDFRMQSLYGQHAEFCDWPISYHDLEPYYAHAERLIGVAGDEQDKDCYAPRSGHYPLPPLAHHPAAATLAKACDTLGYRAFATPRSVNSRPYADAPQCQYCQHCGAYGCPTDARGSSRNRLIQPALASGHCQLISEAMVTKLLLNKANNGTSPEVAGCEYIRSDGTHEQASARIVVVACSAVESARLLLLSANEYFPMGLANRSGLVGRHLQLHAVTMGWAEFDQLPGIRAHSNDSIPFIGKSLYDFYHLPESVSKIRQGGILRFSRTTQEPISDSQSIAFESKKPYWGEPLVERLHNYYRNTERLGYEVFHGFIPSPDTYVELDANVTDPWGLPSAKIHLDVHTHQKNCGEWIALRAESILHQLKPKAIKRTVTGGTTWHLAHGTCRAHRDPKQGVLDSNCRSHDIHNLFIADASFMPSNGAAPPTLTIIANAIRISEAIKKQLNL